MASRELSILVTAKNLASGPLRAVRGDIKSLGDQAAQTTRTTASNLGKIGMVAGGLIAANVYEGVKSLEKLESVQAQTQAVLKSTRGVAGQTADSIRNLSQKYEDLNATIDDKVIQSGANLLLTFTNIRKDAFEPALKAALDMNQAMGGGEEGLQKTIIQVGKALQDPIKGATALRRVGVMLTTQQQEQIKTLVKQNNLYGAQQIILKELGTEFGGSFAAGGKTAAGTMAAFRDAIDDAQMALAAGFLPLMQKVAARLKTLLADPKVLAQIRSFGDTLATGLDKAIGIAEKLPWGAIGSAFKLMGQGAKAALDIFVAMPPWVQTAVLTGWGLNKLTGGAVTGIIGSLGSGLIKGVLGMNAGVVNIKAGVVNGGGGLGGVAGGGKLAMLGKLLGLAGAGFAGFELGSMIGNQIIEPTVKPARDYETAQVNKVAASGDPARLEKALAAVNQARDFGANFWDAQHFGALLLDAGGIRTTLDKQAATLELQLAEARKNAPGSPASNAALKGAAAMSAALRAPTDVAQTLKNLGFTPNMGPKERTSILEQGSRTGTDLFGEQALAVFRQAANPKAPPVLGEISRHIAELRSVEKYYLDKGNTDAAAHAQRTIEAMERLIGVTSREDARSRAAIAAATARHVAAVQAASRASAGARARATAQMVAAGLSGSLAGSRSTVAGIAPHLRGIEGADRATAAYTGIISRKNFSPRVNVNVNAQVALSVNSVARSLTDMHISSGQAGGPGGFIQ